MTNIRHEARCLAITSLSVLLGTACSVDNAPAPGTQAEIEAAVKAFIAAIDYLDVDGVAQSFSTDATAFYPFSFTPQRLDGRDAVRNAQAQGFELMRSAPPAADDAGPLRLRLNPTDMRVQLLGDDAAVVTWHSNRPGRVGRRTSVLQRIDGHWLTVSHHASNVSTGD